jgi:hypothetical protein
MSAMLLIQRMKWMCSVCFHELKEMKERDKIGEKKRKKRK